MADSGGRTQAVRTKPRPPPGYRYRRCVLYSEAEDLLGKSIGMWIDRSLQLSGQLNDSHVTALLELARKRQAEPVDLADDE